MLEREIEQKCREMVRERGGLLLKWISPGTAGVPDRILLMPKARIAFVEFKQPGGSVRKLQRYWIKALNMLGFAAEIIDSVESFKGLLDGIETNRPRPTATCGHQLDQDTD